MWGILKKYLPVNDLGLTYLKRASLSRLKSTENPGTFLFPWSQRIKDDWKASPLLHRIMGLFIMKKILQNVNTPFEHQEFLKGVQFAITAVADAISMQDVKKLQGMMSISVQTGQQLGQCFQNAFLTLSERQQNICLELNETKILHITGIKSIFGKADPSDKHVLRVLGQEIVGSRQKMQSVIEESDSPWNDSRNIGETAAKLGVTFLLDVKFRTQERFYIENGTDVVLGSKNVQLCYHIWQFTTCVDWLTWDKDRSESYPIAWELSDMDQFVKTNFPTKDSYDILV